MEVYSSYSSLEPVPSYSLFVFVSALYSVKLVLLTSFFSDHESNMRYGDDRQLDTNFGYK